MQLEQLRASLRQIQQFNARSDWFDRLEDRKRKELKFHNSHRDAEVTSKLSVEDKETFLGNKKYYSITEKSQNYIKEWLRQEVPDRVFLDYACGDGVCAIQAAKLGAALAIGLDISDVSIENARRYAAEANVENLTHFVHGDCEATGLPDESVDIVLCSGMLHHLDLKCAFPELQRILKPGGKILCVEALNYNPVIKLYRFLTPNMRTDWEKQHILSLKDVRFAKNFFKVANVRFWHLFSILATPLRNSAWLFKPALGISSFIDDIALRIPGLRLMAWQFTFELQKAK